MSCADACKLDIATHAPVQQLVADVHETPRSAFLRYALVARGDLHLLQQVIRGYEREMERPSRRGVEPFGDGLMPDIGDHERTPGLGGAEREPPLAIGEGLGRGTLDGDGGAGNAGTGCVGDDARQRRPRCFGVLRAGIQTHARQYS